MENKIHVKDNDFSHKSEIKIAFMSCQRSPIGNSQD